MNRAIELHSGNCTLRSLCEDDNDLMARMFASPEVVRFSRINPLSDDEARAMLLDWLSAPDDAYWTVLDSNERKIGVIFLRNVNLAHRAAEVGYMLTRESWGKGFASTIVRMAVRHGFGNMGLCRIEAYVSTGNVASLRVLEKCGFVKEGRRRADAFKNGVFEDSYLLSCINEPLIRQLTVQT